MLRRSLPPIAAFAVAATLATGPSPVAAATGGARVTVGWPCAGCIVQLPKRPARAPLLVVLHGDEGNPTLIASLWGPGAAAHHMILFAPQCPVALGCRFANGIGFTSSWWGWLQSPQYVDSWLGAQLTQLEKRYKVDRSREYVAGWSGGADYLGWYALRHASRFAAAAFVAGGVPYVQSCPAAKLPSFFLLGGSDPRYLTGQPTQVAHVLQACGSPTQIVVVPGADHQTSIMALQTRGYASAIVTFMLAHRRGASVR
ncbi:MAG TPA: hypothetical protein VFA05_04500 [Gaiellaceae bacterium]|nr:hypothetical protein [Gaiellaceae bacterium]